ncbi:MAG: M14 family zinc carboxypeptidase, partial [Solirubrobacteraceae bacterium]
MRRRGLMTVPVVLVALLGGATTASAADSLKMYRVTVDEESVGALSGLGVDLGHTGYKASLDRAQTIFVDLLDKQAAAARADGLALDEVVPGPHVSETQIAKRLAADDGVAAAAVEKPETGGDSPNVFYDVFRSYSEPGGIKDEMTSLAAQYRGLAKLVVIGQSGQGQPIVALKVTQDARNVADGARPAMLFSAVNHAREWIAAEVGRRMPTWWLEHADDPEVAELLRRNELWFLPIQNPDGYDYTFTCGIGFRTASNQMCGATLVTDPADPLRGTYVYKTADGIVRAPNAAQPDPALRMPTQRLWRKTVRDNDGNGTYGDGQDGVDPNRNYPTAWNLDGEGASNTPGGQTYRGPFPLSETEDLAYDRLLRKITPEAVINYHSAAQLLLYPFGYITDVYADDDPWFKAITGTDGDAAVDPYISQRSSDLYITNGETTDHAYNKYGSMSWTPELDECETAAGGTFCSGGSGFTFPDDEGKVEAVFEKNLDFARNVAATTLDRDRPDRPRNATDDETQYQVKGSPDIEPTRFNVSYGASQTLEATARRILGPVDFVTQVATGPGGGSRTLTLRGEPWKGGERFGDLRGKYYQRVRTQVPADFVQPGTAQTPRPLVAGDVVNVRVIAGSQQQRFSYRVVSTRQGAAKRVLVVAAEDYTGLSPNKTPYDDAPRYLDAHKAALEANGYAVETFDVDAPPPGPNGAAASKQISDLGVLSHFDAVLYYTGDDLLPQAAGQGVTSENYRRLGDTPNAQGQYALTGSQHLTTWGVRNAQMLRNYMNDGGKVLFTGRNGWVQQTSTGTGLNTYSGYTWWQEPVYGFDYPPDQAGDDDRPHTAFFRELDISNDWGQWWLGVAARQGGVGTTTNLPVVQTSGTGGILDGMAPFAVDDSAGSGGTLEPSQNPATGASDARPKAPTRLRSISSVLPAVDPQRPFRQERVEADYVGQTTANGGAIISTRDSVSVGFGLEQLAGSVRQELVRRMMLHLLPTGADTTAPQVTWLRPGDGATVDAADPVEIEVEAWDERGDMKEVRLSVDGELVQRKVSFPFQMRWYPEAGDVGSTKTLVVEAEDKAGNLVSSTRSITVGNASALEESPLPTGVTTLMGKPQVGETLTCVPSGFSGNGVELGYEWLRDGTAIAGADEASYALADADQGREVA